MEEKEPIKIKLSTAILLLVLLVLIVGVVYFILRYNTLKNEQQQGTNETQDLKQSIEAKVEKLEENEELKDFLSYVGDLNTYKDNNYKDKDITEETFLSSEKIMIASMFTRFDNDDKGKYYNIEQIEGAFQEIFNETTEIREVIQRGRTEIEYDSKTDKYYAPGGDGTYSVYIVKIESQTNSNGIYDVTFLYGYPSEGDFIDGKEGECDCFRTTVKIKVNDNFKYSKYQLVSSELAGKKVGKIKDFIKINENKDESNKTSQSITNNDNKSKSGTKLLQFDTEFYKLEEIALEYRELGKIKNYKDFEYDLDGDGKVDKITIKHSTKKEKISSDYTQVDEIYVIQLNGKNFMGEENGGDITTIDKLYIADLNKNDNKIEVVFEGYGPSDDPHYLIFTKENSTMKELVTTSGLELKTDQKGKVVISDFLVANVKPEIFSVYYEFENGKKENKTASIDALKGITFSGKGLCFMKDKDCWNKYLNSMDSGDKNLGKYGIYYTENKEWKFEVIKFEKEIIEGDYYEEYIKVKLDDGRIGYLFDYLSHMAG